MIGRRSILGGLMSMIGGLPRPRPDQQYRPPGPVGPIGGTAGTFRARTVIIQGGNGGDFVYDNTGNLRSSNVGQVTKDPLQGISCPQGLATYNGHGAVLTLADNKTAAYWQYTDNSNSTQGVLVNSITNTTAADPFGNIPPAAGFTAYLKLGSVFLAANIQERGMFLFSAATEAGPWSALGELITDSSGNLVLSALGTITLSSLAGTVTASGQSIATGRVDVNPAATAPPALPAGAEPWNAVAFVNGWLNAAGRTSATYRFVASPPAEVEIRGGITVPAGFAAGQTIFTLPAAYRPADVQSIIAVDVTTGAVVRLAVDNTGNVNYESGAAAAGNVIDYHWLISLDA